MYTVSVESPYVRILDTCGTLRKWLLHTYVHTYIHGVLSILQSCTYIRMYVLTYVCVLGPRSVLMAEMFSVTVTDHQ